MDPMSALMFDQAIPEFALSVMPLTRNQIEAAYAQYKADGLIWMPFVTRLISVEDWRDEEIHKLEDSYAGPFPPVRDFEGKKIPTGLDQLQGAK